MPSNGLRIQFTGSVSVATVGVVHNAEQKSFSQYSCAVLYKGWAHLSRGLFESSHNLYGMV